MTRLNPVEYYQKEAQAWIEGIQTEKGLRHEYLFSGHVKAATLITRISGQKRVLDVGCGEGRLLKEIYKLDSKSSLIGIDTSQELLKAAKNRLASAEYIVGDGFNLPFKTKFFDVCFCIGVAELFEQNDFNRMIAEMKRVTTDDGFIIIRFGNKYSTWSLVQKIIPHPIGNLRKHSIYQIKNIAKENQLKVTSIKGDYLLLHPYQYKLIPEFILKYMYKVDVHYLSDRFPSLCRTITGAFKKESK